MFLYCVTCHSSELILSLPYRLFPECGGGYNGSSGEEGEGSWISLIQFHQLQAAILKVNQ